NEIENKLSHNYHLRDLYYLGEIEAASDYELDLEVTQVENDIESLENELKKVEQIISLEKRIKELRVEEVSVDNIIVTTENTKLNKIISLIQTLPEEKLDALESIIKTIADLK
ncbi:MAG: hypothetical protein J5850_00905, partial [Clostridia bacterium]|nr:hypothetical protein [Clostridia bacterium]